MQRRFHDPDQRGTLGHVYAVAGRRADAEKLLAELQEEAKHTYVSPCHIARIYEGLGDKDEALRWLERAWAERDNNLIDVKVNPQYDSLHSDPRFADLLRRLGLSG